MWRMSIECTIAGCVTDLVLDDRSALKHSSPAEGLACWQTPAVLRRVALPHVAFVAILRLLLQYALCQWQNIKIQIIAIIIKDDKTITYRYYRQQKLALGCFESNAAIVDEFCLGHPHPKQ